MSWSTSEIGEREKAEPGGPRDAVEAVPAGRTERLELLVDDQAALQRVLTLVAQLLHVQFAAIARFERPEAARILATWAPGDSALPVGHRARLGGRDVATRVYESGRPARATPHEDDDEPMAGIASGVRSSVGAPITVGGRLWGAVIVGWKAAEQPPSETESRLAGVGELVATAVSNAKARDEVDRLAEEQAALRRVATLVAKEAPPEDVFGQVAVEAAGVLGGAQTSLWRDEGDGTATVVAAAGLPVVVGTRLWTDGDGLIATVLRDGRSHAVSDNSVTVGTLAELGRELGITSAVGCPVMVGGRVWGALGAGRTRRDELPAGAERRLAQFADLVATAVANAQARAEAARLAEEQAALRRVATLVAQGAGATAVFESVAAEVRSVLNAGHVVVCRYESDQELTMLAHRGGGAISVAAGTRISHQGDCVEGQVRRTERPATLASNLGARGPIAQAARAAGVRVSVGAPVVVERRTWGVISAGWGVDQVLPANTEPRMARFAQLVGTAIANADSRDQLTASRARLVAAADDARRRVVRDLHDGAQQRLVHTIVMLKLAQRAFRENEAEADALIAEALHEAQSGNQELRELAHGILPAVLASGGLRAGIRSLVDRLDVPVEVQVSHKRFRGEIEANAYFLVAEALTNVAKHAHATRAEVIAEVSDGVLRVEVRDDGIGGAVPTGPGLVGMEDRITALGGRLEVESPAGHGTLVVAALPLPAD